MGAWAAAWRRLRWERRDAFDVASLLLVMALLALALATFRDYSISNDEGVQHRYGEFIIGYYASGFVDRALFHFNNLYLYGGLFDIIAVLFARVLPFDLYVIRHALCAVIGVAGIAATWATARLIAGPRAGAFALFTIAICGVWYGSMFNHTKDIPFAAAMAGATYFLLRTARDLPRPHWCHLLGTGLSTGAALGQRATGLLLVVYVAIAIALYVPRPFALATAPRFVARSLALFVPAFALSYLIMIAAWPWAASGVFNPVRAIFAFAHFEYPVKTLLFGETFLMADVPRAYVPVYLAIKLPLQLGLGVMLAFIFFRGFAAPANAMREAVRARETALIAVAAFLPVICQIAGRGPAFSGMRHFLFVVPPLAVLAGVGFDRGLSWLQSQRRALANSALAVISLWFLWTASVVVRLHPYENLYFNEFVGGLAGAVHRYDTDYWVNVMHEAVIELENYLGQEGKISQEYHVAVCGERHSFEKEAAADRRLKWATDDDPADFFIAPSHMSCDNAINGTIIAKIERMGVTIGVVKDRRALTRPDLARSR
jgi:hypothetical protein